MKLGIDLGGSHVAVGLVDDNQNVVDKNEENFTLEEKQNISSVLIEKIRNNIFKLTDINNIDSIGIACPGTINNGIIVKASNLKITNFNLKEQLAKEFNVEIKIENDGKCAAIAEKTIGVLKQYDDCIFLNIGTGIGGAVFLDGKLLRPKICSGFELGHMTIQKDGILCACGKRGCFERYCSMRVLKEKIREEYGLGQDVHSRELIAILANESELSNRILEEYMENLKIGIANLIDIFEPEAIAIGGSFAYYKDLFLPKLQEKLTSANSTFNGRKDIKLETAMLKNDAGIIGATLI